MTKSTEDTTIDAIGPMLVEIFKDAVRYTNMTKQGSLYTKTSTDALVIFRMCNRVVNNFTINGDMLIVNRYENIISHVLEECITKPLLSMDDPRDIFRFINDYFVILKIYPRIEAIALNPCSMYRGNNVQNAKKRATVAYETYAKMLRNIISVKFLKAAITLINESRLSNDDEISYIRDTILLYFDANKAILCQHPNISREAYNTMCSDFYSTYTTETILFYTNNYSKFYEENTYNYLSFVVHIIEKEAKFLTYCNIHNTNYLRTELYKCLLESSINDYLDDPVYGFEECLRRENLVRLKEFYEAIYALSGLPNMDREKFITHTLINRYSNYVSQIVATSIEDIILSYRLSEYDQTVRKSILCDIINFYKKFDAFCIQPLSDRIRTINIQEFENVLNSASSVAIRIRQGSNAKVFGGHDSFYALLCAYIDGYLRSKENEDVEQIIDIINDIFAVIDERDAFVFMYTLKLVRRLVGPTYVYNDEASIKREESIVYAIVDANRFGKTDINSINSLRLVMTEFTTNISRDNIAERVSELMKNDPILHNDSSIISANYSSQVAILQAGRIKGLLSDKTDTSSYLYRPEIGAIISLYTRAYNEIYGNRKLIFTPAYFNVTMGIRTKKIQCNVSLNVVQANILYHLNDNKHIVIGEYAKMFGIDGKTLASMLSLLSNIAHPILSHVKLIDGKYEKSTEGLSDKSIFIYNEDFAPKVRNFKLKSIVSKDEKESIETLQQHNDKLELDKRRIFIIQAAIVRSMKGARTILHQNLFEKISKELNYPSYLTMTIFKTCVEGLIERGYMMRDDTENNRYHYVV